MIKETRYLSPFMLEYDLRKDGPSTKYKDGFVLNGELQYIDNHSSDDSSQVVTIDGEDVVELLYELAKELREKNMWFDIFRTKKVQLLFRVIEE